MRWFLGAALLLVVGLVFQLGLLVYAMYVLLAVMLVSRFLARAWIQNVSASRLCRQATAEIGEKATVMVSIRNSGALPVAWLMVEDSIPTDALLQKRIKLERKRTGILQLPPRGQRTITYQVEFLMRGYYQLGPLLLESGDLFGLHRRYRVDTEPHFVLVYPKVLPVEGYDLASRRPIGEVRLTHRLFEDPTRIAGVRLYQNGDAFNRIHWKATARTGMFHSKQYEPSTIAGATLLLDLHRARYTAQAEPQRSELLITTAASLANAVYQLGEQIGLVTNGRDAADRVRTEGWRHDFITRAAAQQEASATAAAERLQPVLVETRRGPEQFNRILETLARVELNDGLTFPQLASEAESRMPRDATIVALLPDVPVETALTLGMLKRSGYAVTAILVMFADEQHYPDCMGRLIAEGIDVRRVEDEAGVAALCSQQLAR